MNNLLHDFAPDPNTTGLLRRAFGRFGTGVTVVTAQGPNGPVGMTANSFTSLSLEPALIMWAPALRSRRHDTFVNAKAFCVHVLGQHQLGMAMHFAQQGHDFSNVHSVVSDQDIPTLPGSPAIFHCTTHAVYPAGDHSMIVGQITHVEMHEDEAPGLLFDRGRFGTFCEAQ